MKKIFNALSAVLLAVLICFAAAVPAIAASSDEIPYNSYTYWEGISENKRKAVYNRPMYDTASVLNAENLQVDAFTKLNDVCTDNDGNVYILDDASRITVLNKNYEVVKEIGALYKDGEKYEYAGANSLYVHTDAIPKTQEYCTAPLAARLPIFCCCPILRLFRKIINIARCTLWRTAAIIFTF